MRPPKLTLGVLKSLLKEMKVINSFAEMTVINSFGLRSEVTV